MAAGPVQAGDDVGDGLPDAGDFPEAALADDLRQRHGQGAEALGRPGVGLGAVGVAPAQGHSLPEFAQQSDDSRGVNRGHSQE